MKEYKVIMLKLGMRNRDQKLQEILNTHAREGWQLKELSTSWTSAVLERDKNR